MPFAIGTASVHRDPPHDRDDHDTPLWSGRDGSDVTLIWGSVKQKYFLFRGLTRLPKTRTNDLPVALFCRSPRILPRRIEATRIPRPGPPALSLAKRENL